MTAWDLRPSTTKMPRISPDATNGACWPASAITFLRKHLKPRSRHCWICLRAERKPLAIRLGRHAHAPQEAATQGFFAAEAALQGDALDRHRTVAKQPPGSFHADQFHRTGRGLAGLGAVMTDKTALAHTGLGGQARQAQVAGEVFGDPGVQFIEATTLLL